MKKIENSFAITGYIAKDAEIRTFENASVARYSIIIRRGEKNADDSAAAFLSAETWRKNEDLSTFDLLKKGSKMITLEGYFKPEEWNDKESGEKRNRVIMVATKVYPAIELPDEEPAPEAEPVKKTSKKKGK